MATNGLRLKQRRTITPIQLACLLGLEPILAPHGLTLVCARCAAEGDVRLTTDNDPLAAVWKIDCACQERRIDGGVVRAMDADGDLLVQAAQILGPLGLEIRCREPRCVLHPLDVYRTDRGIVAMCRCAKTTFHPPTTLRH